MEVVLEKILVEVLALVAQLALVRLLAWWRERASDESAVPRAMPAF
jgi:hypothetical protein